MDAAALRRAVEGRAGDALVDLGSSAVLRALCDGPPTVEALLRATWASERAAAETFAGWAATADGDAAAAAYRTTAARERDHADRVATVLERATGRAPVADRDAPASPGPLHAYLRGLDAPAARVGAGLVGRPLASLRTYGRVRDWADAEGATALRDLVAGLAEETDSSLDLAADLLAAMDDGSADREAVVAAGAYAARVVRDDHADALASLGGSFR